MSSRLSSERGAILIHVAVASIVLIAFTMFIVDYGILWVARHQAQNAADAGALAGAVAIAFDNDDRSATGPAKTAAYNFALANDIMGQDPNVVDPSVAATDVRFYSEDPSAFPPECSDDSCIRVDVYRNQSRGNPLPMWFGQLVGLTEQGVRAMAIARVSQANASDCLKPFGIPDKWADNFDTTPEPNHPIWSNDDRFEQVEGDVKGNSDTPLPNPDEYRRLGEADPTGYKAQGEPNDIGVRIVLKSGSPNDAIQPGFFYPVRLPLPDGEWSTGGDDYRENIAQCNGVPVEIGQFLPTEPGDMIGPTFQGISALIARDPYAEWDDDEQAVVMSCAQDPQPCAERSPRVVAIPIFDTQTYHDGRGTGLIELEIVNILGFFIEEMQGNQVTGVLMTIPGLTVGPGGNLPQDYSWLYSIQLVR